LQRNARAAWRSWGFNSTHFGLTPTVKGHTTVRANTLPPNCAKPPVICWHFSRVFSWFFFAVLFVLKKIIWKFLAN
jgi:hypothetical protein